MRCPATIRGSSTRVLCSLVVVYCLILVTAWLVWNNASYTKVEVEPRNEVPSLEASLVQSHHIWMKEATTCGDTSIGDEFLLRCVQQRTKALRQSSFTAVYISIPIDAKVDSVEHHHGIGSPSSGNAIHIIVFGAGQPASPTFRTVYASFDQVLDLARVLSATHPDALLIWDHSALLSAPHSELNEKEASELKLLSDFLTVRHVVQGCGILVTSLRGQPAGKLDTANDALVNWQLATVLEQITTGAHGPMLVDASPFTLLVKHQHERLQAARSSLHARCATLLYTRRFDTQCHPPQALQYPLLITGLGGAGTHHVAQRLAGEGWRVLHEEVGADGAVSWFYAANDHAVGLQYPYGALSSRSSGYLSPRFAHVIHLVRDPAAQISSFTAHSNKTYDFVLRTIELVLQDSPVLHDIHAIDRFTQARAEQRKCFRGESCHLHFAALTWLHWNRFVESFADITFRVDQVDEIVQYVCEYASREGSGMKDSSRYCDVAYCPGMAHERPVPQGMLSSALSAAYALPKTLLGVCQLNERLFRRSANHKNHLQYTLDQVRRLDAQLARDIESLAAKYGFPMVT